MLLQLVAEPAVNHAKNLEAVLFYKAEQFVVVEVVVTMRCLLIMLRSMRVCGPCGLSILGLLLPEV